MTIPTHSRRWPRAFLAALLASTLLAVPTSVGATDQYSLGPVVFDIDAAPDGSIVVAEANSGAVRALRNGEIRQIADIPVPVTDVPSTVNGIAAIGRGCGSSRTRSPRRCARCPCPSQ